MQIQIVLPPRIGDTILSLPALYTFAHLIKTQAPHFKVQLLSSKAMLPILTKLNIFPVSELNLNAKIKSWFQTPEYSIFFNNSENIIGLLSKHSLGERLKRFYNNYTTDIQSLSINQVASLLPKELFNNLNGLSLASKRYFGFLLHYFSSSEIVTSYEASKDWPKLSIDSSTKVLPQKYFTLCLEAANNKTKNKDRAWSKDLFLKVTSGIHQKYGLEVVLLGISTDAVTNAPYSHISYGLFSLYYLYFCVT